MLRLRCKHPNGQSVLNDLDTSTTLRDLRERISTVTGISSDILCIKTGYPPVTLDLSQSNLIQTLIQLGFKSGETITVSGRSSIQKHVSNNPVNTATAAAINDELISQLTGAQMSTSNLLMRKTVPSDNSCLFVSILYCLSNGNMSIPPSQAAVHQLRQLVADELVSNVGEYPPAMLDNKTVPEYCKWIINSDHWGGAMEISIISKSKQIEVDVVDTKSCRIDKFGQGYDYSERILIIYDGIHYDALHRENLLTGDISCRFPTDDLSVLDQAQELANEAKSSRNYTDLANFTLKCMQCDQHLTGEKNAQEHAKATGHTRFGEIGS